nr:hypothetical protein [Tanacetum cinerariifolium]
MFMANLSSVDHVYDEAGPSYDSDILSELHDHDHYQDAVCEHHEVHEMHDDVQLNHVVDSHADYTSDSNMILYDQVDKIEDMGTMHEVQVQLVMGALRTELGGQDNAVDEDVDEQSVKDLALNTMFMANLSSVDHVYDEAGPSYDSDILSELHDHDHYQDAVCEHHEVHEMHDDVQLNHVVDSHADYTSDSNMILYDHLKLSLGSLDLMKF